MASKSKAARGIANQPAKTKIPAKAIKIWNIIPAIIKTILTMAPKIREKKFEIRVLKNSSTFTMLGYFQLYLCHGEKSVFNKSGTEKKLVANTK